VVFVAAVLWDPDPDPERWLRGADGEVRTAVLLEALPARRWHVFHDLRVPGSTANIDHLVIGRSGVWVIDTKTTRAPVRVGFTSIRLGDRPLNTGSVRWQAEVVSARLGIAARPLIVLHTGPGSSRGARSLTDAGPDKRWLPRRGVRVVLAADMVRRLKRGRRRLARWEVEQAAGEVLCSFRQASGQTGSISQPATARRPARITQPYRMS
jgi:hypothetical protein